MLLALVVGGGSTRSMRRGWAQGALAGGHLQRIKPYERVQLDPGGTKVRAVEWAHEKEQHMSLDAAFARDSSTKVLLSLLAARSERKSFMNDMMATADCCTSERSCKHTFVMRHASSASALLRVSAA